MNEKKVAWMLMRRNILTEKRGEMIFIIMAGIVGALLAWSQTKYEACWIPVSPMVQIAIGIWWGIGTLVVQCVLMTKSNLATTVGIVFTPAVFLILLVKISFWGWAFAAGWGFVILELVTLSLISEKN